MSSADPSSERRPDDENDESPSDRDASTWGGYALAALLALVFLVGLLRVVFPTASVLVIGGLLALFGVFVGVLAVRERIQ